MSVFVDACPCAVSNTTKVQVSRSLSSSTRSGVRPHDDQVLHILTKSSSTHADDSRFLSLLHRLGGASMLISPLLLLVGESIRIQARHRVPDGPSTGFDYPGQLAAYQKHPALMTASTSSSPSAGSPYGRRSSRSPP